MYQAKAPHITQTVERRIRCGEYHDRIPSTRSLADEFGVARHTVTKAVRVLVESKLLTSCRRNGLQINRRYLKKGTVLIVAQCPGCYRLLPLMERIRQDNWSCKVLDCDSKLAGNLADDTLGVIYLDSSLTLEAAGYLRQHNIPFVSGNQLPGYRHINWVDFDSYQSLKILLKSIVDAGYRRIGVIFSGRMENFNDMLRKNILRLKRELGLPHEAYDDVYAFWQDSLDDTLKKTLSFYRQHKSFPEVLISFVSLNQKRLQMLTQLPEQPLLLMENNKFSIPDNSRLITFNSLVSSEKLYLQCYELLREAIFTPDMFPQQRLVLQKYTINTIIPKKEKKS